jgi:hypothetical protein
MSTHIPMRPHFTPGRFAVVDTPRPVRSRDSFADPTKRSSRRVLPALFDADLNDPATFTFPHRPIAARLVGILGPIGLALFLAAGYACGLKLYTSISPLEDRAICVLAGFLAFFLITVWPTFGDDGNGKS